ncbi:hypothetical protein ACFLRO_00845 [Bacteroidota bacterium]
MRSLRWTVFVLVIGLPSIVDAQMFSYGGANRRSVQSLSFVSYLIDFEYNGDGDPENRLDFSDAAYGVAYNRSSFAASIVWGQGNRTSSEIGGDLNVVDASVAFWGNIIRTSPGGASQFGVPFVVYSGYRSVDPALSTSPNNGFTYSSLGIGTGATFHSELSSRFWLDVRAWPVFSMSFRSFEGFAGSSFLVDTDAQLHVVDLFGSMGLSIGYGFRYQTWNNNESGLPGGLIRADEFDYKSSQHMVRAGINW